MRDKETKDLTMKDILKVCFGRKILLIIITIIIAIASILTVDLFINKNKKVYTVTFEYAMESLNTGSYMYGGSFDYRELLEKDNLEHVKDSSEAFKDINLSKLIYSPLTSIKTIKHHVKVNNSETDKIDKQFYLLTLPVSSFQSHKQAIDFIENLVYVPVVENNVKLGKINFLSNLDLYEASDTFDSQVGYLIKQFDFILNEYDKLMEENGNYALEDGTFLSDKKIKVQSSFEGKNDLNILYSEIEVNGYIKSDKLLDELKSRRDILTLRLDLNERKLKELMDQREKLILAANGLQNLDLTLYNEQIIKLSNENKDLEFQIETLTKQIDEPKDSTAFEKKLDQYKEKLISFTKDLEIVEKEILTKNSKVYFDNPSVVEVEGGYNLFVVAAISLILGLFVGAITNLIIDRKKLYIPIESLTDEK